MWIDIRYSTDQYISNKAFKVFIDLNGYDMITYMYYLKHIHFRFDLEPQPEAWMQQLVMSRKPDGALTFSPSYIYTCMNDIFGMDMICRDASDCYGIDVTIIQALVIQLDHMQNKDMYSYSEETLILHIMHIYAERHS